MFADKLKFILLPQLIATLNNYACSLPLLANVDWSAFPECFFRPCKSSTGEMALMEGSIIAVAWGPDITPTAAVSTRLCRPCSGMMHVDIIATLNSTIVSSCFLVLSFATNHPTLCPSHSIPYIH